MRRERGLSSAASCSGFSDREQKEAMYLYTGSGKVGGTVLPPWQEFTTKPQADVHVLH